MSRHRHFHLDHAGHSVTLNIRDGRRTEYELLVDGKEVGYQRRRRHSTAAELLSGELPGEPPRVFDLEIEHPADSREEIVCVLEVDGARRPMAEGAAL
ncbi:hypothetical protein OG871_28430 [Kitasatospora sp. NBC_00374]|uniref:hypothetical protein n=1 Tax=Kitasatospora sp. NBC_00374 TaxID=2975964 RepID=UPI00324CE7C6